MAISSRVSTRIATQTKKYQGVLSEIQKKDISEAEAPPKGRISEAFF